MGRKARRSTSASTALTIVERANVPAPLADLAGRAGRYAEQAKASTTRRAYASDWQIFSKWCEAHRLVAMPADPGTVLAFLVDRAGEVKVATLSRYLVAIREAHKYAGHALDTSSAAFRDTWRGIRREHGEPPNKKAALMTPQLASAVAALPNTLIGARDRALLLVGFAAALRRSELSALEITARPNGPGWIERTPDGLVIHLARTKTDQEGAGATLGVPYGANPATCPVRAYGAWLEQAALTTGPAWRPITRHGKMLDHPLGPGEVARIVKRAVMAAAVANGATTAQAHTLAARFAGHSLRRGLATSAAANDAPGWLIQRHMRHRKADTTNEYIEAGQLFKKNAAGMAGL